MFGQNSQQVSRSQDKSSSGARVVVCELDASSSSEERILDALAACEEHDAELRVVWVFEPARFGGPIGAGAGSFGLPAVLASAVTLASERGIAASSAVRFGEREVVLRESTVPRESTGRDRARVTLPTSSHTPPLAA
jgi:hypothetical protein